MKNAYRWQAGKESWGVILPTHSVWGWLAPCSCRLLCTLITFLPAAPKIRFYITLKRVVHMRLWGKGARGTRRARGPLTPEYHHFQRDFNKRMQFNITSPRLPLSSSQSQIELTAKQHPQTGTCPRVGRQSSDNTLIVVSHFLKTRASPGQKSFQI